MIWKYKQQKEVKQVIEYILHGKQIPAHVKVLCCGCIMIYTPPAAGGLKHYNETMRYIKNLRPLAPFTNLRVPRQRVFVTVDKERFDMFGKGLQNVN